MRTRKLLSALLPIVVACSENTPTPTDIKPPFLNVAATSGSAGTTYGLSGLKPDTIPTGWGWTGGYLGSKNLTTEKTLLAAGQSHSPRIRMIFSMTGGDEQVFKNANGSFNLQRWKDTLDRVASPLNADGTSSFYAGLLPYIRDTTYLAVRLLDDPANFTPPVSFSDIEAMAAYSKKRFPLLPTAIRERPTVLKSKAPLCGTCSGGHQPYAQLDMGWAQYRSDRGKAADYRDAEISAARDEKLGIILGINLNDGGPPVGTNVSVDSALSWGTEFLRPVKSDYACALFLWDNTYPNLASSVFNTLASMAANHVKAPCTRRP